jgi:hypothetical protein
MGLLTGRSREYTYLLRRTLVPLTPAHHDLMGILDKFRPQSKWKHADPAVRLASLQEIGDDAQDVLVSLAEGDADARVRRAVVPRISDPATLAGIVRNDADGAVRDEALGRLVARAATADGQGALAALASLGRQKELAAVARSSAPEPVRQAAVAQITDAKALGGIARHAQDGATRLLALGRVVDAAELEAVAVRGEFADAAVGAVDRLTEASADVLGGIAQRAKTKAAAKRAKALLAQREAAAQPAAPDTPAVEYREADQARARELCSQMAALDTTADIAAVREGYGAARVAWVELLADVEIRPEIVAQFESASDAVRARLAADDAARVEASRQAEAQRREQAERIALCERLEGEAGEDLPARIAELREAWAALPPMPAAWAGELQRRFDDAARAAERRHERRLELAQLAERAPGVVAEVETLAGAEDYDAVRSQWQALRRQWQAITREVPVADDLRARFDQAAAGLEAREQALRESRGQQQAENLQRLQALVGGLEARAAADTLTLKDADQLLKDVKLAIGTMGPLPTKQDRDDLTVRLQAVRGAIQPRIKEMRDAEEWKRWANVQVQEELCVKMEALLPIADSEPEKAATEMRALQERWKQVAAAPRSQAEVLWTRFKAAQEQVYEKCKDFFAQQAAERQENLKRKEALCVQAEALSDSTDWVKTADALKALQAEWKAIGGVTRGREKAVWERFRAACDKFFTRRQEDLKTRKHDWAENLARKEALIAEAEQLAQSTEWDKAIARIKQLQAEWKGIGPVKKSKSEAVWQRFRGACDTLFERYKNKDHAALQGKLEDRETAVAEIEALVPAADAAADAPAPADLYAHVQAARARWLQGPELPRHVLTPLGDRVNAALLALVTRWPQAFAGTDLDPETTARKMEKLCAKVEALLPQDAHVPAEKLSPAEMLARQWREALAANTMGVGAARQAEEARQRAIEQEVRSAQSAWARLGPLAPEQRKPLQERFDRAIRKLQETRRRHQMARA